MSSDERPDIDENRAVALVTEMMAIPGPSGCERAIQRFLRDRLSEADVPDSAISEDSVPKKSPRGGEVGNLIVKLPGTGSAREARRLLMAHVDTVPLCVGSKPVRRGEFIVSADPSTALGGDDRAGAAVTLNALLEIKRQNLPHPPLTFLWPVQEEIGLFGARYVTKSKLGNPRLCFNWDGGRPHAVTIGATGDIAMEIAVHGIASHAGGHPEDGVSAIVVAARAIADLQQNGWHGLIEKGRRRGTSNVGFVEGGAATNVVTPLVRLRAEARSHDPRFRQTIVDEYRKAFERAAKAVANAAGERGHVEFHGELKYEAFRIDQREPSVVAAMEAVRQLDLEPEPVIGNGGLDANWMTAHGFPTVTLGCGQQSIHTVKEALHVGDFLTACRVGLILATGTESVGGTETAPATRRR